MIQRKIQWLVSSAQSKPIQMGPTISQIRKEIPYPKGIAKGYTEQTVLMEGISIIQEKHIFLSKNRPEYLALGTFEVDLKTPSLVISVLHSGEMLLYSHDLNQSVPRSPNRNLFYRSRKYKISLTIGTKKNSELTIVLVPEKTLNLLLGDKGTAKLLENLRLPSVETFSLHPFPTAISEPLRNCVLDTQDEGMRNLYAQTKIIQHIIDISMHLEKSTNSRKILTEKKFNLDMLYQDLLNVTSKVPTLTSLSKKYGVPPSTLNAQFTKKYKESIYSFISNHRLEQAHEAIVSSSLPMKIIAHRMGYSHVNNFITAFKNKFGITPASLRR